MFRRIHRVLIVAGFLAMVAGLWPSPAQAITCKVQNYHWCSPYVCCAQTCVICYDALGNEVGDVVCSDAFCYDKYN
jgi:hypothetical protein